MRVLNTEEPLAQKLTSWNPEFSVPNGSIVLGQQRTVEALQSFARDHKVNIQVRFVTWDEAFDLLNSSRNPDHLPDVAQIGSTWAAYFARQHLIQPHPDWQNHRGHWRDVGSTPASALPYTSDVRLLFYWKRLPTEAPDAPEFHLNASSWESIVNSIRASPSAGDTLVLPTGRTLNLLHDYILLSRAGGGEFLTRGWLGPRVDLTSHKASFVPEFLARNARAEPIPGEPRRFVTFPESGHEEVVQFFVNGGYRATLEPANFVDRWHRDFVERWPHERHFWDYASAVVPPVTFKGGSELVVLKTPRDPTLAFALADFLASDPTNVLAQAGFLPAQIPGYGIDALVQPMSKFETTQEPQEFVKEVQKAMDQGQKYPDEDFWPVAIESKEALESLQRVWRRMGEGDVPAMRSAAKDAEWTINTRINWFYATVDRLARDWQIITCVFLVAVFVAAYLYIKRMRADRRLILLLQLDRAHRHDAGKFLGDNLTRLSARAKDETWPVAQVVRAVSEIGEHFTKKLVPHISDVASHQLHELQGKPSQVSLADVILKAFDGACFVFEAREMAAVKDINFMVGNLPEYRLNKFPFAAVVVFEEWLFNCVKDVYAYRRPNAIISAEVENRNICVYSPGRLDEDQLAILLAKPAAEKAVNSHQGLPLIRNILHYAYGIKAQVNWDDEKQATRFSVRLPIKKMGDQGK